MGFDEEYIKALRESGRYKEADKLEDEIYGLFDKPEQTFEDNIRSTNRFRNFFFKDRKEPRKRSGIIKETSPTQGVGINPLPTSPRPGLPNKSIINKTIESFQMEALQVLISEYENLDPEDPEYNIKRKELIELIKAMKEEE